METKIHKEKECPCYCHSEIFTRLDKKCETNCCESKSQFIPSKAEVMNFFDSIRKSKESEKLRNIGELVIKNILSKDKNMIEQRLQKLEAHYNRAASLESITEKRLQELENIVCQPIDDVPRETSNEPDKFLNALILGFLAAGGRIIE